MCDLNIGGSDMTNYRKILELYSQGDSQRSIESSVRSSHQTVRAVIDWAAKLNVPATEEKHIFQKKKNLCCLGANLLCELYCLLFKLFIILFSCSHWWHTPLFLLYRIKYNMIRYVDKNLKFKDDESDPAGMVIPCRVWFFLIGCGGFVGYEKTFICKDF